MLATPQLLPPLHQKAEGFQHPKNGLSLGFPAQALNPHQLASQGPPNSKKAALSKEETFLFILKKYALWAVPPLSEKPSEPSRFVGVRKTHRKFSIPWPKSIYCGTWLLEAFGFMVFGILAPQFGSIGWPRVPNGSPGWGEDLHKNLFD